MTTQAENHLILIDAARDLMQAEMNMMRRAEPRNAECWTWGNVPFVIWHRREGWSLSSVATMTCRRT